VDGAHEALAVLGVLAGLVRSLRQDSHEVRRAAATSLGKLGVPSGEVVQALIASLADKDSPTVAAAAEALGGLHQGSDEVVSALSNVLRRPDFTYVKTGGEDSEPLQARRRPLLLQR
jgi:HEAT repeat protein